MSKTIDSNSFIDSALIDDRYRYALYYQEIALRKITDQEALPKWIN